jgi:hypothetical protein
MHFPDAGDLNPCAASETTNGKLSTELTPRLFPRRAQLPPLVVNGLLTPELRRRNYRAAFEASNERLHTPHVPPSFAQCLQYLQFLQALHGSLPVQVEKEPSVIAPRSRGNARMANQAKCFTFIGYLQGRITARILSWNLRHVQENSERRDPHSARWIAILWRITPLQSQTL